MVAKGIMHQIIAWQQHEQKLLSLEHQRQQQDAQSRLTRRYYPDSTNPQLYFTHREIEIMIFLEQGLTYKQAALIMGLSDRTIECHVRRMRIKTGSTDRFVLIQMAKAHGLFDAYAESESLVSG